jgi:5-methylthioadenosine/S-adenosylhomocysteine deaminase
MFTAMRMTLTFQRNLDNLAALARGETLSDDADISCREALEWVTVNGARMVGQDDRIGSLAPGKKADIVLLRTDDLNLFPIHDPYTAIVRHAGVGNVDTVIVNGAIVKRGGRMLHPGLREKQAELLASGERIFGALKAAEAA